MRTALASKLIEGFRGSQNDHAFHGVAHILLLQMGTWRLEECIPVLIENLAWRIDRATIPPFKKYPPWVVYPAGIALSQIGGRWARKSLFSLLGSGVNEEVQLLCAWVLARIEDENSLCGELERLSAEAKTEQGRKAFRDALARVKKGDAMFLEDRGRPEK